MTLTGFIRVTTILAVIGAAIVCGWLSYEHAYHVVLAHGEGGWLAKLYPGTVDGLIYTASMVLLDHARRGTRAPSLAKWLLTLGIAATLTANVWAGLRNGFPGAAIAAWPAFALVGSYEMLMQLVRNTSLEGSESAAEMSIDATVTAHEVASTQAPRTPLRVAEKAPSASHRKRTRHGKGVPTINEAVELFREHIQAGNVPSIRAIKRELNVGDVKARSYQSHFQTLTGEAA